MTEDQQTFECKECSFESNVSQEKFNYCPSCGALGQHWQALCNALLTLYDGKGKLPEALKLYRKSSYSEAARSALISLEVELKRIGETDSSGVKLVNELLSFEYDKAVGEITKQPIVKVNELANQNERNEQDGIRFLMLGMFKGLRNTLIHNQVRFNPVHALSVVVMADLLMDILNNGSILNTRVCVWTKVKVPPDTSGDE